MSGFWNTTEQAETGETQYVIARLQTSSSDITPQQLTPGDVSSGFNVSGYSQGSISFKTDSVGGSPIVSIEGNLDGSTWFSLPTAPLSLSSSTVYEIRWTIAVKEVRIKFTDLSSDPLTYFVVMAEA